MYIVYKGYKIMDEEKLKTILNLLRQIRYQMEYLLSDIHKCDRNIIRLENELLGIKKAPR